MALALLALAAGAACTSLPVQEVSDARQAIRAAHSAGGGDYTPETLREAQRLVDEAARHLAQGDYAAARATALDAKRRAMMAREVSLSAQTPQ